jgi:Na+-translocating ferredoxin:NAD+ oxidoreductase RnfA subunit
METVVFKLVISYVVEIVKMIIRKLAVSLLSEHSNVNVPSIFSN